MKKFCIGVWFSVVTIFDGRRYHDCIRAANRLVQQGHCPYEAGTIEKRIDQSIDSTNIPGVREEYILE